MKRIGILSFASPGHYYPITTLGRRLLSRGHEVVYFQVADLERPIRAAGLEFRQIGREDFPLGSILAQEEEGGKLKGLAALRFALRRLIQNATMLFRDAPAAIRDEGVEALVIDQVEMAGGTVAELLDLPFVSVAAALPLNLDASVPPIFVPWQHRVGPVASLRNRLGNAHFEWTSSAVLRAINRQRRAWRLSAAPDFNSLFSDVAQVAQLPSALELPGRGLPPGFHHTGPWTDPEARAPVDFPWDRLDPGRPLVYASMGTLQNRLLRPYQLIAQACAATGMQLVISLGGGQDPSAFRNLPGDPLVVGFAPQLELIRRASLTICHGGLNTTLESLEQGIPLVVLPVAYDQPGVGARVELAGVGRSIPIGRLTASRLHAAVAEVLGDPAFRDRANAMRSAIAAEDGLNRAAVVIEEALENAREPHLKARLVAAPGHDGRS